MKRPALQNKRVGVLRMAFRARKVFETFEKRAPAPSWPDSIGQVIRATFSCNLWRNVVAKLCCPYYHPRKQLVKHQDLLPKVGPSSTSCNMLLQLATLKFVAREVACGGGNTVNKALQLLLSNNVASQVARKCCPYYLTL